MGWSATVGVVLALGGWSLLWLADRRSPFHSPRGSDPGPVEVPGFKPPGDDETDWLSPRAVTRLAGLGALAGAVIGWVIASPDVLDARIELGAELFGVSAAGFLLLRTLRDVPVVGEAPPDDPEQDFRIRVRNAAVKFGLAALMLGFVWLTLG